MDDLFVRFFNFNSPVALMLKQIFINFVRGYSDNEPLSEKFWAGIEKIILRTARDSSTH